MAGTDKLKKKNNKSLTGAAGEHYALAQLLLRQQVAALTPRNAPDSDILINRGDGILYSIQVKSRTGTGRNGGWHMGEKHESPNCDFYCFIDFGASLNAIPRCYIVPSAIVASLLKADHQAWRDTPGKKGQKRNDTKMRILAPDHTTNLGTETEYKLGWLDKYENKWDLLKVS